MVAENTMSTDLMIRPAVATDASGIVSVVNPIIEAGVYTAFDAPFTVAFCNADPVRAPSA